jgi:hypothetical protein
MNPVVDILKHDKTHNIKFYISVAPRSIREWMLMNEGDKIKYKADYTDTVTSSLNKKIVVTRKRSYVRVIACGTIRTPVELSINMTIDASSDRKYGYDHVFAPPVTTSDVKTVGVL